MKKVLSVLLTLMLVATTLPMSIVLADEIVASESLTQEEGVYLINNAADLKKAAEMINTGDAAYKAAEYKLTADIDYQNNEWVPIGLSGFSGKFYGDSHVVRNLKLTTNHNLNGFFGDVSGGAVISDLGLENFTMKVSGGYWAGAYASRCYGSFTNCYVANSTLSNTGGWALGGFVGAPANAARFTNCYVYNVSMDPGAAGFAGKAEGYCYFYNCCVVDATTTAATFYNFCGNPANKAVETSACYSNVENTNTSNAVPATYTTDKSAMLSGLGSAYVADEEVNNGYPCLKWQIWDGQASESLAGTGKADDPYLISSAADLKKANELIVANANGEAAASFKLTADINFANQEWVPITFSGTFDGAKHKIKNVQITNKHALIAFFADTTATTNIKDLGLENVNINVRSGNGATYYVGVFLGRAGGTTKNCYVKNSSIYNSTGEACMGGFAGEASRSGSFENCYVYNVTLNSTNTGLVPGMFVGQIDNGDRVFKNCYAANVTTENVSYQGFGPAHNNGNNTYYVYAQNCYTTSATTVNRPAITATQTTDKQVIAAGLGAAYITYASINDGYPCFAWEIWNGEASASLKEQDGSYLISNAADLKKAAEMVNSGNEAYKAASYKLTADIDYVNYEWTPIGLSGFAGKFNGNGHVVKNLKITTNNSFNGFFGDISSGAVISNLGLENMTMDLRDGNWTGGYASRCYGTFENCYIANSTLTNTGGWAMGAFVGASANAGTYRNCYVYNVALNGKDTVSSFAGTVEGYSYFYTCYTADVTSATATAMYNLTTNSKEKPVTVSQCYSNITTTATAAPVDATVADKAAMAAALPAFAENSIYKLNSKINNGYPSFTYQKAASYDKAYEVTLVGTVDGATKIRLETNEVVDGAKVYVATYEDSGRLIAAETLDPATIMTSTLSGDNLKVFVWDADNGVLAKAYVK